MCGSFRVNELAGYHFVLLLLTHLAFQMFVCIVIPPTNQNRCFSKSPTKAVRPARLTPTHTAILRSPSQSQDKDLFHSVNHRFLRLILRAPPRIQNRVILTMSGLPFLDSRIRGLVERFFSRAQASSNKIVRGIGDYDTPGHPYHRIMDGVVNPFVDVSRKQCLGEPFENLYAELRALTTPCEFGDQEDKVAACANNIGHRVRSFGDDMGELEGLKVTPPSSPNNKPEDIIASTSQSPNSETNTMPLGTSLPNIVTSLPALISEIIFILETTLCTHGKHGNKTEHQEDVRALLARELANHSTRENVSHFFRHTKPQRASPLITGSLALNKRSSWRMSDSVVAKLPKPQLRGLLASSIKFHLPIAIVVSIASGVAFQFLVCEPRKRRYAEFYKNYDIDKEFERMKQAGVFQSYIGEAKDSPFFHRMHPDTHLLSCLSRPCLLNLGEFLTIRYVGKTRKYLETSGACAPRRTSGHLGSGNDDGDDSGDFDVSKVDVTIVQECVRP
uniref:Mitochondrial cytochrome c oxidase subunit VIc/VIIs domain-containing protein n=1 Tax=Timema shepardi TaxID=629360 RepID=A0A7R9G4U3_TIMSH|nr:unnamed protein product [Timema shepardi]